MSNATATELRSNRKNPPIDRLIKRDPPPVDLPAIREEILDYLRNGTTARQADIAAIVGMRRETITRYSRGQYALTDIMDVYRLYAWMIIDKKERKIR